MKNITFSGEWDGGGDEAEEGNSGKAFVDF